MNKMANDQMVNGLMFDFTPPHYGNVVKYGDG